MEQHRFAFATYPDPISPFCVAVNQDLTTFSFEHPNVVLFRATFVSQAALNSMDEIRKKMVHRLHRKSLSYSCG
jgi:hypothetical protein